MRDVRSGLGLAIAFLACGGGNGPSHVEISGKAPADAAAIAARTVCTHDARCGHVSITCMGSGAAGGSGSDAGPTMSCMATIESLAYNDCYVEASADIAHLLTCAAPTPEQVDTLETCFDMLASKQCVTQAEADAQARAAEMGNSPPPQELPAACALITTPPAGC